MGEVIDLKQATLIDNQEFVSDMCRFQEGIGTEKAIRKKYRMAESAWEALALDDKLVRAIEAESIRRIRDGSAKKEKAQSLVIRAPDVLGKIMDDDSQSARHRIDSCKVLNDFASGPGQNAPAADRFLIQINLGSDSLVFNKSIRPLEPGEIDPDDTDTTPMIAAKKEDGGDGNAI